MFGHISRGYTQVLSKMPFFPTKAIELQKIVYKREDLTLICNCEIVFYQNKKYVKSYIKTAKISYFRSFNTYKFGKNG